MPSKFKIIVNSFRYALMKSKKTLIFLSLILTSFLVFNSCSVGKYCAGGKKKYKRMKKDTNMMIF